MPSPYPRVTAQCYFPVTGTETATFPPAPHPSTYSSPWSPGWESHHSLEWKHRRAARCRVFPRMAHSLQRTHTPCTPMPSQLSHCFQAHHHPPSPARDGGRNRHCSCTPKQTPRCSAGADFNTANQENTSWSQPVRKPTGKLKGAHKRGETSEYRLAAAPEAFWTPALALKLQPRLVKASP